MAIEPNIKTSGVYERTGIVEFTARGILSGESHRAFYNCKSVYLLCLLCFIALLWKRARSKVEQCIEAITDSSKELNDIKMAKMGFMSYIIWFTTLGADTRGKVS